MVFPLDYIYNVLPNIGNLELTIKYNKAGVITNNRYKFVIHNNTLSDLQAHDYAKRNQDVLNASNYITITGQSTPLEIEVLRTATLSNLYRNVTMSDVIIGEINRIANSVKLMGKPMDLSPNIATPNNINRYMHVVLPTSETTDACLRRVS